MSNSLWPHGLEPAKFLCPWNSPSKNTGVGQFSSVQSLSRVWLLATPWTAACQASLSITNSRSPPKPMSIESVMPSNHLILYRPLLLLPSIFPRTRVFSNESALHIRWPKYWSFSFSIIPSKETPGLISFRMDWLDLLAVQGTLKSLLQHHSSKAMDMNLGKLLEMVRDRETWPAAVHVVLKSRDITLPTKVRLVKAMVFPVVMYGYESWIVKKAERWRIDAFELWYWRQGNQYN